MEQKLKEWQEIAELLARELSACKNTFIGQNDHIEGILKKYKSMRKEIHHTKYKVNINWTIENSYIEDWRVLTKDEYLNGWMLCQEDWDERVQAGVIIPLREDGSYSIEFEDRDALLIALCEKIFGAKPTFKK